MIRFLLLLCRTLGKTLRELREQMSQQELSAWLTEYQRRPWGDDIEDLRIGHLAATVANFSGHASHAMSAADFAPRWTAAAEMTDEELQASFDLWGASASRKK